MSGLTTLFSSRATQGRRSTRRRVRGGVVAGERLEPRALLTVSVPPGFDMASGRVQVGTAN